MFWDLKNVMKISWNKLAAINVVMASRSKFMT